ncbi:hypothetical protein BOVMAS03_13210 [Streptococcus uberis]
MFRKSKGSEDFYRHMQEIIGQGYVRPANFSEMYQKHSPQQFQELIDSLEETIQFLEYQKHLSIALEKGRFEEVQDLLKSKKASNLLYLQKDGNYKLEILMKSHMPQ